MTFYGRNYKSSRLRSEEPQFRLRHQFGHSNLNLAWNMSVSFVVLYNCLVRGLIVPPMGYLYEPGLNQGSELTDLELRSASSSIQLFSCLYAREITAAGSPVAEINADRRVTFLTVDDEVNNQLGTGYQDGLELPSSSTDAELLSTYPATTPAAPAQPALPSIQMAKRNCHIIKCPKFSQSIYGSDGVSCYEFPNQCFMAVASCKRHNNRLPRLKEITKKHCDKLIKRVFI